MATSTQNPDGTTTWRAQSGGANLLLAVNGEYRMPVVGALLAAPRSRTAPLYPESASGGRRAVELVGFFDTGAGWLLPRWLGRSPVGAGLQTAPNSLGGSRPLLVRGTNGILRASTGVEARIELPVLHQTLRVHYAFNPLRLVNAVLPDGSPFRLPDRRSALGWALGSFF